MPINRLENVILDLLDSTSKNAKTHALNLGGISGPLGGIGGPPGGFIGQLPQVRVAYDEDEIGTSYTPASGMSLLDNLNHIRGRLDVVESGSVPGSITVVDDDFFVTYSGIDTIHFSGAGVTVVDLGAGEIQIKIIAGSGSGGDDTYLRLDAANSPITGKLGIVITSFDTYSPTPYALEMFVDTGGNGGGGISIVSDEVSPNLYLENNAGGTPADFEQFVPSGAFSAPTLSLYREKSGPGAITGAMVKGLQSSAGGGSISGKFIDLSDDITSKFFTVDADGIVNIPTGSTYNINGSPHAHAGGTGGAFQRVLTESLTLADGESLVIAEYINLATFDLTLDGDATLHIL
jgi:hypothetical protein